MKKMMLFLVLSVSFLLGGIMECRAQMIERTVELRMGETLYISFAGIFSGEEEVYKGENIPGQEMLITRLGKVSAYMLNNVGLEDEGVYYFGHYENIAGVNKLVWKLKVTVTIKSSNPFVITNNVNMNDVVMSWDGLYMLEPKMEVLV